MKSIVLHYNTLTIKEFAQLVSKSPKTIYRWISRAKKGIVSPLTIDDLVLLPGAHPVIKQSAFLRYMTAKEPVAPAATRNKRQQKILNEIAKIQLRQRINRYETH